MSVNQEIRDLLASFNTPAAVGAQIADAFERIEQEQQTPGLEVGDRAPDFELPTAEGKRVRLSERLSRGPVVLSFFRGAWCPVCNLQIAALNRALPDIKATGASLLAIHPDSENFEPASDLDFDVLRDIDQSTIRAYKLQFTLPPELQRLYAGTLDLDLSTRTADGSWSLPTPGTFIVDRDGVVRRRHVTADFTKRMEPEDVLDALNALENAPATG